VGDLVSAKTYLYAITTIEHVERVYHIEAHNEDDAQDYLFDNDVEPVTERQTEWDIDSIECLMEIGPDDVGD
jgi:hypothetical protein